MKILHLDAGREMRGGQWQVLYLLRGLRERGHELKLLARKDTPLADRAVSERFDAGSLSLRNLLGWQSWADVVHAHDARSHTLAALSAGSKLVVSRRVAFAPKAGWLSCWKYSRARHYIAISRFVAATLAGAGIGPEAVTVIYDGVPLPATLSAGRQVASPAAADPMKGSDLVREAGRLAGVEILFSDHLSRDLPHAGLFVYASRSEGLGSAALLAMAHGLPVVASRVGGLVEAVEDGVSGVLVDNDAANIAQAIRSVLDNPSFGERLGRAARERVERQFRVDTMVEETVRVYQRVQG